ncbi:MAG: glycosyltransferase [Chlorobium sp.]
MANIIIFIHDDYAAGGLQRSAMNIGQALMFKGHSVTIFAIKLTPEGFAEKFSYVKNVSQNHKFKCVFWYLFTTKFRELLKSNKDSVFIALGFTTSILLVMLSLGIKIKGLIGSERIYPPMETPSKTMSLLRYIFFRRFNCVVAQSQKTRQWFGENVGLNDSQLTVIPNVVYSPTPKFNNPLESQTVAGTYKNQYPVIACVGRLTPQKGFDYAIKIFAIIQKQIPLAKLIIVGDGPEHDVLVALVNSVELSKNVSFVPKLDDLSKIYYTSDILLFPSRYEGFPNVLAEAMAHGLPSVAFDCLTGPADLIDHGVNGYLTEVGDIIGAAEFSLTLLNDHELRARFASRAINVVDKFSIDVIGEKWSSLVERVSLNR